MRALQKIVFINSAHIRYAEVKLDGNVHFIGTQGVGKSTLLRAILFFYNADKQHLGIPKEMRSFDEFYLPYANSYIIYEVAHEHGPFCVLVFRSSGRACYRFIDAEFKKEWLIDSVGEVTSEAKVIRERLGGIAMSKIVDGYDQFRNIIYGNRQAVDKEFARYRLIETNRYQNIPRSIQNVFLNSRLDAEFIKEIIIRSMNDEEANIDLVYFRRQVADFEQEHRDISLWYKADKKSELPIRIQAQNAIDSYRAMRSLEQKIEQLCEELNYAVRVARERLPMIAVQLRELSQERDKQQQIVSGLRKKYEDEKTSLNQELGVVKDRIRQLKEKKQTYALRNIEELVRRASQEHSLKSQLAALNIKLNELTTQCNDIKVKYQNLRQTLENQFDAQKQDVRTRINLQQEKKNADQLRLFDEKQILLSEVESQFGEKINIAENRNKNLQISQNDIEKELVKRFEPYKTEIDEQKNAKNSLLLKEKELRGALSTLESKIKLLQSDCEKSESEIKTKYERQIESKREAIAKVKDEIDALDNLLAHTKGSLYEWLEENKPDWEQTIGKLIDEEHVLYQQELHPKSAVGDSLYGVQLDLSDLPVVVRTPSELKSKKAALESNVEALTNEIKNLQSECDSKVDELRRKALPEFKKLRDEKSFCEIELSTIPQKIKSIEVRVRDFEAKAKQEIEARKKELNSKLNEIAAAKILENEALEKIKDQKKKELARIEQEFKQKNGALEKACGEQIGQLNKEIRLLEQKKAIELGALQEQEFAELNGRGADINMVNTCQKQISAIEGELRYIDDNRRLIYDYQKDKEELFDKENEINNHKKQIEERLVLSEQKFAQNREQHDVKISNLNKAISQYSNEQTKIESELKNFEGFAADERLCPPSLHDKKEQKTHYTVAQAVDELRGSIVEKQTKTNQLKERVNLFKGNFSAKNTFHFRTELAIDQDYFDFAQNLDDFIQNNKIEEYRRRISERYVDILARVSKEVGELTCYESEVDKVIRDINNDFRQRIFAGVIKLIELQSVPSSNKMVGLMKRIKEFHDENSLSMGALNLFSTDNSDNVNDRAIKYLLDFMNTLNEHAEKQSLTLSDLFQLQFRIVENDNDTGWVGKLSHVGSEGTDTLVKAMINIMLINVFKEKVSKKFGDFRVHCMMDEIGKLHPQNVKGILDFAGARNILLINSSPTTYNVSDYKYTYLLSKDSKSQTTIHPLISQK